MANIVAVVFGMAEQTCNDRRSTLPCPQSLVTQATDGDRHRSSKKWRHLLPRQPRQTTFAGPSSASHPTLPRSNEQGQQTTPRRTIDLISNYAETGRNSDDTIANFSPSTGVITATSRHPSKKSPSR